MTGSGVLPSPRGAGETKVEDRDSTMDDGRIDEIIDRHRGDAGALIQVLLEIQRENHWLSSEVLERVGKRLSIPASRVRHIASFHKAFSLAPEGRHEIHVCDGTSCHVRGSQRLLNTVQALTGIEPGETDPEMRFSLKSVTCMGRCAQGPVMTVDGDQYGKIAPAEAEAVLKKCD
jgi:NADH-quinone oxidoreductase subunit E